MDDKRDCRRVEEKPNVFILLVYTVMSAVLCSAYYYYAYETDYSNIVDKIWNLVIAVLTAVTGALFAGQVSIRLPVGLSSWIKLTPVILVFCVIFLMYSFQSRQPRVTFLTGSGTVRTALQDVVEKHQVVREYDDNYLVSLRSSTGIGLDHLKKFSTDKTPRVSFLTGASHDLDCSDIFGEAKKDSVQCDKFYKIKLQTVDRLEVMVAWKYNTDKVKEILNKVRRFEGVLNDCSIDIVKNDINGSSIPEIPEQIKSIIKQCEANEECIVYAPADKTGTRNIYDNALIFGEGFLKEFKPDKILFETLNTKDTLSFDKYNIQIGIGSEMLHKNIRKSFEENDEIYKVYLHIPCKETRDYNKYFSCGDDGLTKRDLYLVGYAADGKMDKETCDFLHSVSSDYKCDPGEYPVNRLW